MDGAHATTKFVVESSLTSVPDDVAKDERQYSSEPCRHVELQVRYHDKIMDLDVAIMVVWLSLNCVGLYE